MRAPTGIDAMRVSLLRQRIEAEFRGMPGLRLTRWQAARLWSLEYAECEAILRVLCDARVLRETSAGFGLWER